MRLTVSVPDYGSCLDLIFLINYAIIIIIILWFNQNMHSYNFVCVKVEFKFAVIAYIV